MKNKVLVYVDAENVSVEKFQEFLEMQETLIPAESIVLGKFYGNPTVLGEIMPKCYSVGYEFVDTSTLTASRKNAADMKLVVDCIYEAMCLYAGEVKSVIILSSDRDFMPLVYKLMGNNFKVELPFISGVSEKRTCADITRYLEGTGYRHDLKQRVMENPFFMIQEYTGSEFSEELLDDYVSKKKRNLASEVLGIYGKDVADGVVNIPSEQFSFQSVWEILRGGHLTILEVLNMYTKKVFGLSLNTEDAMFQLQRMGGLV